MLLHDNGSEERLKAAVLAWTHDLNILEKAFGLEAISGLREAFQPYTEERLYEGHHTIVGVRTFGVAGIL